MEHFCKKLDTLRRHDFIAKEQSHFCTERKESLQDGEVLVIGDFAENYSFVLEDAAQGYTTGTMLNLLFIHFVSLFQRGWRAEHHSYVAISDCLNHDAVAIHLFQKTFLIEKIVFPIKSIIYFSDGAPTQYKNCKKIINLFHHKMDLDGIDTEWHYFCYLAWQGACDGIGGTVKRLAALPYSEDIMTPKAAVPIC